MATYPIGLMRARGLETGGVCKVALYIDIFWLKASPYYNLPFNACLWLSPSYILIMKSISSFRPRGVSPHTFPGPFGVDNRTRPRPYPSTCLETLDFEARELLVHRDDTISSFSSA